MASKKSSSTKAGKYVKKEMHAMKHGSKRVKSRKQAIAVGLSEARRAGVKVKGNPNKSSSKKKSSSKSSPKKSSTRKSSSNRKSSSSRATRSSGGRKKSSSSRSRSK